ncbi:cytochrome c-type biogenesis protein CcmH [Magnetovirga frankeli]|uniref:cytochrome c-type biogenesis protein n=1 Tax=Magnetovirga frankeli TaxID=947516 RepID=UPI00129323CE|nr:cytochrome c-type biogenesis protein CcmH [gamma proteobacterium SS-5]
MKRPLIIGLFCLSLLIPLAAQAAIETYDFQTPAQEALYKDLIAELRCLVCQNQNIADSNAELAQDLRRKTHELIMAGKSREEITTYMVQRYGDFVLYQPPLKPQTALLWVGPFLILGLGLFVLIRVIRQRSREATGANINQAQREQAERLLQGDRHD